MISKIYYFIGIAILIRALTPDFTFAESVISPTLNSIQYAEIINNTLQKKNCSDSNYCPIILKSLNSQYTTNSFLGFIESSKQKCKELKPTELNAEAILKDMESNTLKHLGPFVFSYHKMCLKKYHDNELNNTTQLSYILANIENQQVKQLSELHLINDILNSKTDTKNLCSNTPFPRVQQLCANQKASCAKPNDLEDLSYYTRDAYEELTEINKQLVEAEKQLSKQKTRHFESNEYKATKQRLALLEEKKKLTVSRFPWLSNEDFLKKLEAKTKPEEALKWYFSETKKRLEEKLNESQKVSDCFLTPKVTGCNPSKIQDFLANDSHIDPSLYINSKLDESKKWLNYQECLVSNEKQNNDKSSQYWHVTFDVGLTIATLGVGSALSIPKAVLSARKIMLSKQLTQINEAVNIANFANGLNNSYEQCFKDNLRLQSNSAPSSTGECAIRDIYFSTKLTKSYDDCMMSIAFATLDASPLAAGKIQKQIQNTKTTEKELQAYQESKPLLSNERRHPEGQLFHDVEEPLKKKMIEENLHYSPTTVKENIDFTKESRMALKNINNAKSDYTVIVTEHSMLKEVNDLLKNKDLATSYINMHKKIVDKNITAFLTKWKAKGLNVEISVNPYSDFKSMKYLIKGKTSEEFNKELIATLKQSNIEYLKALENNKLIRKSDQPEKWFRAGIGNSDEQASIQARLAREDAPNTIENFNNPKTIETLNRRLDNIEDMLLGNKENGKIGIVDRFSETKVVSQTAEGTWNINEKAIDIIRKNTDNNEALAELKQTFGLSHLSESSVQELRTYLKELDTFSPSLQIPERKIATLTDDSTGGLTGDMVGMGSINTNQTNLAIQRALKKKETDPLTRINNALIESRVGERLATREFKKRQRAFTDIVENTLGKDRAKVICSGDDCVCLLSSTINLASKERLVQNIANQGYSGKFRMAFVSEQVKDVRIKNLLATQGESIEKTLRKALGKEMEPRKLQGVNFGVDMVTDQFGQGPVRLIIGTDNNVKLSESERKLIEERFNEALKKLNEENKINGQFKGYSSYK